MISLSCKLILLIVNGFFQKGYNNRGRGNLRNKIVVWYWEVRNCKFSFLFFLAIASTVQKSTSGRTSIFLWPIRVGGQVGKYIRVSYYTAIIYLWMC